MSESDKMGLFGSKEENNETTSEEKKSSGDPQGNSSDRCAPYNIDSDSETYDTEALSIMDINDIIGVQADTPGESTLESEFAALSEIITDSKDEFASQLENTGARKHKNQDPGAEKQSEDENGEASVTISKSLQLIGEAYISEDSQLTDSDDETENKKSENVGRSLESRADLEEDEKRDKVGCEAPGVENVEKSADSLKDSTESSVKNEDSSVDEESTEKSADPPKNTTDCTIKNEDNSADNKNLEKSTDSADSAESAIKNQSISVVAKNIEKSVDSEKNATDSRIENEDGSVNEESIEKSAESPKDSTRSTIKDEDGSVDEENIEKSVDSRKNGTESTTDDDGSSVNKESVEKSEDSPKDVTDSTVENEDSSVNKENVEKSEDSPKDATDAAFKNEDNSVNDEPEAMDVDCTASNDEKSLVDTETPESGKPDETPDENSKTEAGATETAEKGNESMEEPMEVDVPVENETKVETKTFADESKLQECDSTISASDGIDVHPEMSKSIENDSDSVKFSSSLQTIEEESESEVRLSPPAENPESLSEKQESAKNDESRVDEVAPVEEKSTSLVTQEEFSSKDETVVSLEKPEIEEKSNSENGEKVAEPEAIEQMEIDEEKSEEAESEKSPERSESLSEKNEILQDVDETRVKIVEPETSEAVSKDDSTSVTEKLQEISSDVENSLVTETGQEIVEEEKMEVDGSSKKEVSSICEFHENDKFPEKESEEMIEEKSNIDTVDRAEILAENLDSIIPEAPKCENDCNEEKIEFETRTKEASPESFEKENEKVLETEESSETSVETKASENDEIVQAEISETLNSIQKEEAVDSTKDEETSIDKIDKTDTLEKEESKTNDENVSIEVSEENEHSEKQNEDSEKAVLMEENMKLCVENENRHLNSLSVVDERESPDSTEKENLDNSEATKVVSDAKELSNPVEKQSSNESQIPVLSEENGPPCTKEKDTDSSKQEISTEKKEENVSTAEKVEITILENTDSDKKDKAPEKNETEEKAENVVENEKMTLDDAEISVEKPDTDEIRTESKIDERPDVKEESSSMEQDDESAAEVSDVKNVESISESKISEESIPVVLPTSSVELEEGDTGRIENSEYVETNEMNVCVATDEKSEETEERENLKSAISTTSTSQVFNDDEQSQSTQEMMDSILEKDKTKINKIIDDDEEASEMQSSGITKIDKLPKESEEILSNLEGAQNIDSLEGLLDLDLIPDEESDSKSAVPIDEKAMKGSCESIEGIGKNVSLLMEKNDEVPDSVQADNYDSEIGMSNENETATSVNDLINKSTVQVNEELEGNSDITEKDLDAFDLTNPLESVDPTVEPKIDLAEDLLCEIADEDESKIKLAEELMLENDIEKQDLIPGAIEEPTKIDVPAEVFLPLASEPEIELAEEFSLDSAVREEVLNDVVAEMESLPQSTEISELESAVKFLQESEEQDIGSPLVLSSKMVDDVVDDIAASTDVGIFAAATDICEDPSELVAEFENIIPDPIAISEAEIINEAAKLEIERKTKLSEGANSRIVEETSEEKSSREESLESPNVPEETKLVEIPEISQPEIAASVPDIEKIDQEPLKKSAPIPKTSILEERLKIPPKIEIPVGEVGRMCESATTPKTSLLMQRDAKATNLMKQLESPKSVDKSEPKVVEASRKENEKYENVGSPRIILKIAKSAIADCSEPRSPKSPKIRSATNSPNPEDSPGQKLGKIKLKLSKGGHPSIISNENVEEQCGQWHTEGSSSLSPLGMKIKFSKISESQAEKHEAEEAKEPGSKHKFEEAKRTDSPLGMKIKLSKTGEPSIVQQEPKENAPKHKDKLDVAQQDSPKRTESSIGMKIKLSKSGDASIIQPDKQELSDEHKETRAKEKHDALQQHGERSDVPRRTESPLGMKFKLFKTGDASIVPTDSSSEEIQQEAKRTDSPVGKKTKVSKTRGGATHVAPEHVEETKEKLEIPEVPKRTESPLGMKIKLSKRGDASIIHSEEARDPGKQRPEVDQDSSQIAEKSVRTSEIESETPKRFDPTIGMKIKLSKTGDASIVHPETSAEETWEKTEMIQESMLKIDSSIGMKIKLSKTGDASIVHSPSSKKLEDSPLEVRESGTNESPTERREKSRRKEAETPLEMKIKLSKTGHPTIVACESYESSQREIPEALSPVGASKSLQENVKTIKGIHGANLHSSRTELTIEPVQLQGRVAEETNESVGKRKDITISPVESKKAKLETKLSHILPEVTIQPIVPREQKSQIVFETNTSTISRQQMNVISQEISITQVRPSKSMEIPVAEKLKSILTQNTPQSDCEIIEHRPELIIVNENSNSSQDVMIIEEVPIIRGPENKTPKKRGRPRRNPLPIILSKPAAPNDPIMPRDPLALDDVSQMVHHMVPKIFSPVESELPGRPKRTCRSQKSYAPPKRGRGRGGRGKRKMDMGTELHKRARLDQDLEMIERSTTALITIHDPPSELSGSEGSGPAHNSELYKALRQPTMDRKMPNAIVRNEVEQAVNESRIGSMMDARLMSHLDGVIKTSCDETSDKDRKLLMSISSNQTPTVLVEKTQVPSTIDRKIKETSATVDHENWLTPSSKRQCDVRNDGNMSNVQVMDEETRMSAESGSRSQTPAKNISLQAPETIVNEESQGSVLSTATTESEKVKVKNRRMEINFDPDEGPFTVDKIAEYDWPPDPLRKNETFMIQEQISQYLGVKSFKRKYPDLKRRMVDMEEKSYLRENGLVNESMCDMGLTAVLSSEVLDIMCSDFPDQYEEYRKYMREKQMKEHFKRQKELTAAANAEKNRIDLAEMAVQSALSWNVGFNKARRESRKCSLDLQTFTIHVPKKQQKVDEEGNGNHYPVALIPGQYTDYYREYTPAELRYYPLNTVLYGPMRPNERKFDSQSEGSQSDSDSDSSSDDSSSSSSEGTQDTEASQSTMDDVDTELSRQKEDVKSIKCKMCLKHLNKFTRTEVLIQCGTCNGYVHPSCIDLTLDMVPHIQAYAWQCTDCKTCAQCHDPADEDKMLFCDMCDRGYHIYCVGLRRVPQGRWHCQECAVCASCGSREAGGTNSDRNSVAQWQHEYKKGDKNTRVYVSTLCVPCSKLWRKGRYCPHCSRCHTVPRLDLEANLVHCSACDKYLHLGCVESKDLIIDRKNYRCDFCQPLRQHMVKPLVSKVFRT